MFPIYFSLLLIISALPRTLSTSSWAVPSSERVIAIRSQRDVSANVTIDQLSLMGVGLSMTVFDREGYVSSALSDIRDLLDTGVQVLAVDLYWHEQLRKFQLCPYPLNSSYSLNATQTFKSKDGREIKCQSSLRLTDLAETVHSYLTDTDTNLSANLIILLFNILSISDTSSDVESAQIGTSNDTLSSVLLNYFDAKIYTPDGLNNDRSNGITYNALSQTSSTGWPTTSHFLFSEKRRLLAASSDANMPSNTTYQKSWDVSTVFNSTFLENTVTTANASSPSNSTERALESWRLDFGSGSDTFTTSLFSEAIAWGYSPVINSTSDDFTTLIGGFMNESLWSWAPSQPLSQYEARRISTDSDDTSQSAFSCGSLSVSEKKWQVSNCYADKHVACRLNNSTPFRWAVTVDKFSYFHAEDACADIPKSRYVSDASSMAKNATYIFSVPKSALEQKALNDLLSNANLNATDVWIDMNSIAIPDCWVTGGAYANCPYKKVSSHRNFVEMLTPSAVFCGVLLLGIMALRLRRVPIHDNRKYWKKLVNEYAESEYDGVPS